MYYVYVLKSDKDGNLYTGFTSNLKLRKQQHDLGLVISTRNRRPLVLVYYQAFLSKTGAQNEERYLKSGGKAKSELKLRLRNTLL